MRRPKHPWLIVSAVLTLAVCLAGGARADTIVLKNGRRIAAANIIHENGKVSYETSAGWVTFAEALVDRIEKDSPGKNLDSASNPAAANFAMGPPPVDTLGASGPAARSVVHDGGIDRDALAQLDAKASGGAADAVARAVAAESAASQFEFGKGDLVAALEHAERALALSPEQLTLLLNVGYLHDRRGEYTVALDYLVRARRVDPDSPDVAKLAGWADYGLNRLEEAVAEWRLAQQLRPDAETAKALEKAERDMEVEGNFREGESAHFVVRYDGAEAPDLARAILPVLEDDFRDISVALNYTPSEPVTVILYTNQVFADITQAPNWVGALNDGRIRVPVQGLTTVTPELASVLKHELTHSIVSGKTQGRCPVWLQEGVAQWMEGKRAAGAAAMLVTLYDNHQEPSLTALEGSWMNMPADYAGTAYAWSLAVVEALEAASPGDTERLLDGVAAGPSTEAAARSTLHMDYADLGSATADYLRQTYLQH